MGTSVSVILPQPMAGSDMNGAAIGVEHDQWVDPAELPGGGYPTLWLLHGLSDDHTAWIRQTAIERYVKGQNLAVVMPAAGRSYYADMAHGGAYWRWISQELPRVCRGMLRLSDRREDNFVAGLSMGGYGAFKLAMNYPERYAAAASLSGALDPAGLLEQMPDRRPEWINMFGDPPRIADGDDLFAQAEALAAGPRSEMPLYQCCGDADFLYQDNLRFRDHAQRLKLNLTYEQHADREHEWGYWDQQIQRVLAWLPRG